MTNKKSQYYFFAIGMALAYCMVNASSISTSANAQASSLVSIGNNTGMASDTFFQLDDSVLKMKSLVNQTQTSIENNNTADAKDSLNQIYDELIQISNNSNSLIWDESNEGN